MNALDVAMVNRKIAVMILGKFAFMRNIAFDMEFNAPFTGAPVGRSNGPSRPAKPVGTLRNISEYEKASKVIDPSMRAATYVRLVNNS